MYSRYVEAFNVSSFSTAAQKDIAIKIVAITVSELNSKIPWSKVPGLKIRITGNSSLVGLARYKRNDISISTRSLSRSIHYIRWLVCHEIAHLVVFKQGHKNEHHGKYFKTVERQFCASFGIRLAWNDSGKRQAYPIAICGPNGHFERR